LFGLSASSSSGGRWPVWLAARALAWLATAWRRALGQRGPMSAERLTGMVLVALAVQMFLDGLDAYLGRPG
jgi:multiple antibiotic resistance protein